MYIVFVDILSLYWIYIIKVWFKFFKIVLKDLWDRILNGIREDIFIYWNDGDK